MFQRTSTLADLRIYGLFCSLFFVSKIVNEECHLKVILRGIIELIRRKRLYIWYVENGTTR